MIFFLSIFFNWRSIWESIYLNLTLISLSTAQKTVDANITARNIDPITLVVSDHRSLQEMRVLLTEIPTLASEC